MAAYVLRPAARQDLIDHFLYLEEHAGLGIADRFLANAETSFAELAERPAIGSPLKLRHPDLKGTRKWRVKDFDNFLIFYLPRYEGVSVIRVLHSASDWWSLLDLLP